jgi:NTE family protein
VFNRAQHTVLGNNGPMSRLGLVLGAGGIIGPAYHLSTLAKLREQLGIDHSQADFYVGTSGGSIVATLLAAGESLDRLTAAFGVSAGPTLAPTDPLQVAVDRLLTLPHLAFGALHRPPRVRRRDHPDVRQRIALRTSAIFAQGAVDPLAYASPFHDLFGSFWPSTLRICAVQSRSGRRRVFGPDDGVPLAVAAAASCAVPGMFLPVEIDGEPYSDGGFFSPTNADVALGHRLSHVTIVSPMTSALATRPAASEHPVRVGLHVLVARERRQLRHHGIEVTLIEPGFEARRIIAGDYMDPAKAAAVAAATPPRVV